MEVYGNGSVREYMGVYGSIWQIMVNIFLLYSLIHARLTHSYLDTYLQTVSYQQVDF
jgi:hypothetical protein